MKVLAITNQKGGVGKTTTAHHLAVALSDAGYRVLAVDLDPQAHLTVAARTTANGSSAYDVLRGRSTLTNTVVLSPHGIDVLPSEQLLARLEAEKREDPNAIYVLRNHLDTVANEYDWCVIDTPPSLGLLSTSALLAANAGVLVPLTPEALPLKGLQLLLRTVDELKVSNPHLYVRGIVPTMVRPRWASHRSVLEVLPHILPDIDIPVAIPTHGSFARASAQRVPIFMLAPNSSGSYAYRLLASSLIESEAQKRPVGFVA